MKKRLLIYDLDGTLVDTAKDIAISANYMRKQFGLSELPQNKISEFVGRGVHHLISHCIESDDEKLIEKAIKVYRDHYKEHMLDYSRLFPGAKDFLKHFESRIQAVLTNKPNPYSKEILDQLGVGHYFVEVMAGNSGYQKKPDPDAILQLMKKENVKPEETLMIGDSRVDIETCRNAHITAAVLTHGFESRDTLESAKPEVICDSFSELLEWIKEKGW